MLLSSLRHVSLSLCAFRHPGGPRAFCQIDATPAFCLSDVLWMLSSTAGAVFFKMRWQGWWIQFLFSFFVAWRQLKACMLFVLKSPKLKEDNLSTSWEAVNGFMGSLWAVNDACCISYHSEETGWTSLNRIAWCRACSINVPKGEGKGCTKEKKVLLYPALYLYEQMCVFVCVFGFICPCTVYCMFRCQITEEGLCSSVQ